LIISVSFTENKFKFSSVVGENGVNKPPDKLLCDVFIAGECSIFLLYIKV
jgi:hypothetical protein